VGNIFIDERLCIDIFENSKRYIYLDMYIGICRRGFMPLTRKARIVGSSLVITIPSQLAKANDINNGDDLEIIPSALGEFKIRKIKK
jgi:hypothetical protein